MATDRQGKLVNWLKNRKVASMRAMRHQFRISQPTLLRYLKRYGYLTSYNYNGGYYTLHDVPQFDEHGLWAYRKIRFSKFGTLAQTIVASVQNADQGMTTAELEQRLQTSVANLLGRLVQQRRLSNRNLCGRHVVYLAAEPAQAERQFRQRHRNLDRAAPADQLLPTGVAAEQVIAILRQMVLVPDSKPEPLARRLARHGIAVTTGQVRQVIEHYALEKKRHRSRSSN